MRQRKEKRPQRITHRKLSILLKGSDNMEKKPMGGGYVGNIKNTGNQVVEAPVKMPSAKKGGKVVKGKDLRVK